MSKNNVEKTKYGYDLIWAETEWYHAKIMVFESAGNKSPITFHKGINKSWFVNTGNFKVTWIDTTDGKLYEKEISEGVVFHITAHTPVGIEALTDNASISQVSNSSDKTDACYLSA